MTNEFIQYLIAFFILMAMGLTLQKLRYRYRAGVGLILCILSFSVPWNSILSPDKVDASIVTLALLLGGVSFITVWGKD